MRAGAAVPAKVVRCQDLIGFIPSRIPPHSSPQSSARSSIITASREHLTEFSMPSCETPPPAAGRPPPPTRPRPRARSQDAGVRRSWVGYDWSRYEESPSPAGGGGGGGVAEGGGDGVGGGGVFEGEMPRWLEEKLRQVVLSLPPSLLPSTSLYLPPSTSLLFSLSLSFSVSLCLSLCARPSFLDLVSHRALSLASSLTERIYRYHANVQRSITDR
jgi:hypothetical protein